MHVTLFRPVGSPELELIKASGWKRFPPRLESQPIFYPVTNELYAWEIARCWNEPIGDGAHVVRFQIPAELLEDYPIQCVGQAHHTELWVPAEDLDDFNEAIVGLIEEVNGTKA